jgi:quinol monooxygenase YgiN
MLTPVATTDVCAASFPYIDRTDCERQLAYAVAVNWQCKPGFRAELLELATEFAPLARLEEGCLFYQIHTDPNDPELIFIYELYTNEDAFKEHIGTPYFERLVRQGMLPLLESRSTHFYITT